MSQCQKEIIESSNTEGLASQVEASTKEGKSVPVSKNKIDQETEGILKKFEKVTDKTNSFKAGRNLLLQCPNIDISVFNEMNIRNSLDYVFSKKTGVTKKVSRLELSSLLVAIPQLLFNQSYVCKNTDTNSGTERRRAELASTKTGTEQHEGRIIVSLVDLCRLSYGTDKPTNRQKKAMATLLRNLHSTPIEIKLNGGTYKAPLCFTMGEFERDKDKATIYDLLLNPIFCNDVMNNFGELPQDIMKRLNKAAERITEIHIDILRLLTAQEKGKPFTRSIENLVDYLNIQEQYKCQRSRTEAQILKVCDDMVKIRILKTHTEKYVSLRAKKVLSQITFTLNEREPFLEAENEVIDLGNAEEVNDSTNE